MLSVLFLDLNSFFASVEQHLQPRLRGRPVAVVPVMSDHTCCIAASYEAKRSGVKTGTRVADARRLCPELTLVEANHRTYVEFHHRIIEAAETCLPVAGVHSIDEFSFRLMGREREPASAVQLARAIKAAIAGRIGESIRCSIGIAPNRFLAKVGTDMQKPDGLVLLESHDLPHKLFTLDLIDLPGIGTKMLQRLHAHGVRTVEHLCSLPEKDMERIWGGVVGRRWWYWLRGYDLLERPTKRQSIGHQHVLPPKLRDPASAREVAVRLLHKAAARARHLGYWPGRITLSIEIDRAGTWGAEARLQHASQNTVAMTALLDQMWAQRPVGPVKWIDVTLSSLTHKSSATIPLFPQERREHDLCAAVDAINTKYSRPVIYSAATANVRNAARGGIAFSSIPDLRVADSL